MLNKRFGDLELKSNVTLSIEHGNTLHRGNTGIKIEVSEVLDD